MATKNTNGLTAEEQKKQKELNTQEYHDEETGVTIQARNTLTARFDYESHTMTAHQKAWHTYKALTDEENFERILDLSEEDFNDLSERYTKARFVKSSASAKK